MTSNDVYTIYMYMYTSQCNMLCTNHRLCNAYVVLSQILGLKYAQQLSSYMYFDLSLDRNNPWFAQYITCRHVVVMTHEIC